MYNQGIALIPLVFVFAGLVVTVALAFSTISLAQSVAVESEYSAARALHFAEAGLNDALMRLSRDHTYRCEESDCNALAFTVDGCTSMTACVHTTITDGELSGTVRIVAHGVSNANTRILERSITFDAVTGAAHENATWCEQETGTDCGSP